MMVTLRIVSYLCTSHLCKILIIYEKQVGFLQKKETNTFGSKILKNLGLKKSGHLEIRGYLNFSQFLTLGQ